MASRLHAILAVFCFVIFTPFLSAAEGRPHLFILAGEAGMEKLDEAKFFTPIVQSALGKDKVVVVKSAKGEQPIHRWYRDLRWGNGKQPEDAGRLFADLLQRDIDRVLAARKLADADACETVTLVWMQGRSDAVESHANAYLDRFKGLVRQMRLYRKRHDLNVIIARINDHKSDDKFVQAVRTAQVQAAKELPRAGRVDTDDLNGTDNSAQLTPEGYKTLGARLAQKAVGLIKGAPKKKHLFILSGQSNMANLGEGYFTPYVEALYGKQNATVVKNALGGKPISRWYKKWVSATGEKPKVIGDLYDALMDAVRKKTEGRNYDTVTFVWMQGESDSGAGKAEVYLQSLKGLVQQLSDDLKRKDVNLVIGRINSSNLKNAKGKEKQNYWRMIREVQVQATKEIPRSAWVDTDDLWNERTGVHMTKDGYRKMGQRFAKAAAALVAKQGGTVWDNRLTDMIPTATSLPRDQRIAYTIDKDGKKRSDDNWQSIGTPVPEKREWRYVSFNPADGKEPSQGKHDPKLKLVSLPDKLSAWYSPEFDDSSWSKGAAPIGCNTWESKDAKVLNRSDWGKGKYLIARTTFTVDSLDYSKFRMSILCRLGNVVYLNGHQIRNYPWSKGPSYYAIPLDEMKAIYIKRGKNVIAVYANSDGSPPQKPACIDVDIEGFKRTE